MKKTITFITLFFLLACASSPQRIALNTLQGIRDTVTTSVKVFNVGYQAGQFSEQQRTDLKVLYNKYLAADTAAATALLSVTDTQASAILSDVTILANAVIQFVQSLKGNTSWDSLPHLWRFVLLQPVKLLL
jgi:hypothetical protein